jgi:hypothetical protein
VIKSKIKWAEPGSMHGGEGKRSLKS